MSLEIPLRMSLLRSSILIASTALVICSPFYAQAYKLRTSEEGKVLIWDRREVEVEVDLASATHLGPGALDAVQAAFLSWTGAGVPMAVSVVPLTGPTANNELDENAPADGRNVVRWIEDGWPFGKHVVAMTLSSYHRSTGLVFDTDIVLNAEYLSWEIADRPGRASHDVQNVVTHEAGHFFGLGHSDVKGSVMSAKTPPGQLSKRTLSADDRLGIAALIPEINARVPRASSTPRAAAKADEEGEPVVEPALRHGVGCSVTANGGHGATSLWLVVVLISVLALRRKLSAGVAPAEGRTLPTGDDGSIYPLRVPVRYRPVGGDKRCCTGLSGGISSRGLFIASYSATLCPVGTRCEIELTLPADPAPIEIEAEVLWHRPARDLPPGMGLLFTALDRHARDRLSHYFADCDAPQHRMEARP